MKYEVELERVRTRKVPCDLIISKLLAMLSFCALLLVQEITLNTIIYIVMRVTTDRTILEQILFMDI